MLLTCFAASRGWKYGAMLTAISLASFSASSVFMSIKRFISDSMKGAGNSPAS
jgi:hypothetical protein